MMVSLKPTKGVTGFSENDQPQPQRTLEEIRADILALERETDGLLGEILGGKRP
jgi:hypothetical protein